MVPTFLAVCAALVVNHIASRYGAAWGFLAFVCELAGLALLSIRPGPVKR